MSADEAFDGKGAAVGDTRIVDVTAREILDTRGSPTVQVDVRLDSGTLGTADAPAGVSKGEREAIDLRDGDERYDGRGVGQAVRNVNEHIAGALIGERVDRQRRVDQILVDLDGTSKKERLGTNATTATSLAVARAAAAHYGRPLYLYLNADAHVLPIPQFNFINGGAHAANQLGIQEFMLMPTGVDSMAEAVRCGSETYSCLRQVLTTKYGQSGSIDGEGGGYAPQLTDPREALNLLHEAAEVAGWADKVEYGLDCAANEMYDESRGAYRMGDQWLQRDGLMALYRDFVDNYRVTTIEDPFHADDWDGYSQAVAELGIQIVGDDLFATNTEYVAVGISRQAANALLLKVNQVGTLSEALDAANLALRNGYRLVPSERSGETDDTFLSDLSVALNAGQIKTGAPVGEARTAKFKRLVAIEEELGSSAVYGQPHRGMNQRSLLG